MDALASEYGRPVTVVPLQNDDFKEDVADATQKFLVPTPQNTDGFLQVSGAGNPQLVGRAVANIETARRSLSAPTAAPVLAPVMTGKIAGADYAIWPRKRPFETANRVLKRVRYRLYARRIVSWSQAVCLETLCPADPQTVTRDLQEISQDSGLSDAIRHTADRATERLATGQWAPLHCLHHGDFWAANLLRADPGDPAPFHVIDWGGMQRHGYPFLDLCHMLTSLRTSHRFNRDSLEQLRQGVGCAPEDMQAYILCAYGRIGRALEHFPRHRYRIAVQTTYQVFQ